MMIEQTKKKFVVLSIVIINYYERILFNIQCTQKWCYIKYLLCFYNFSYRMKKYRFQKNCRREKFIRFYHLIQYIYLSENNIKISKLLMFERSQRAINTSLYLFEDDHQYFYSKHQNTIRFLKHSRFKHSSMSLMSHEKITFLKFSIWNFVSFYFIQNNQIKFHSRRCWMHEFLKRTRNIL